MKRETRIKLTTAVLARDKGFPQQTYPFYNGKGDVIVHTIIAPRDVMAYASSQSELQTWFREVHDIHINPQPSRETADHSNEITGYYMGEIWNTAGKLLNEGDDEFSTYEEALEAGLFFALKLI